MTERKQITISTVRELSDFLKTCPDDVQINITIEKVEGEDDGKREDDGRAV